MKAQTVILVTIVALLLLGGAALAQPGERVGSPLYAVEPATASGGAYHLAGGRWQVSCPSTGQGYRLWGPVQPQQAPACCCAFLPLATRSWP